MKINDDWWYLNVRQRLIIITYDGYFLDSVCNEYFRSYQVNHMYQYDGTYEFVSWSGRARNQLPTEKRRQFLNREINRYVVLWLELQKQSSSWPLRKLKKYGKPPSDQMDPIALRAFGKTHDMYLEFYFDERLWLRTLPIVICVVVPRIVKSNGVGGPPL